MSSNPLSGERRVVTALFCDVVGSTALAETMDPEDWGELIGETISQMGRVVARYGGTISEFGGDSVFAIFGAPTAHEDDPYRAVKAALEIVSTVDGGDAADLAVRAGVNTGLVVVGDIEAGALNTYSALGDTLNVAARLQTIAEPKTVVMSSETRHLLGTDVEVRELGPVELKGRKAPVEAYEVVHLADAPDRRRGVPGHSSPMVGRDQQLETLQNLARLAAAGSGRVAAILGEPGVGKSRLIRELQLHSDDHSALWAFGHCVPYEQDSPYHLLSSLVLSAAGIAPTAAPDVIAKSIDDMLDTAGSAHRAPILKRLVGIDDDSPEISTEELTDAYADAITELLAGLGESERPIVLVCEDTHWADQSSVDVMSTILTRVPTQPVLLLIVMRPERQTPGWALLESARREIGASLTEVDLAALDADVSRTLVANLLSIESLPPTMRRLIVDKASGNPFFLEEVVRMLIDRGLVEEQGGHWGASQGVEELEVPETIQGLLASRIDLLNADERAAGRLAAVIGRNFSSRLFNAVHVGHDEALPIHPHVAALESHGMVRLVATEPEIEYEFRHALIHDVMYRGLLRKERVELHGAVADAIEAAHPDRLQELAPALARHHGEGRRSGKAIEYLFIAGRDAASRGARLEASRFYASAQRLLAADPNADPVDKVDAAIGRLTAAMSFTPFEESLGWIREILPVAEELGEANRLGTLYDKSIWIRGMLGQPHGHPEYLAELDKAHELVSRVDDPAVVASLEATAGSVHRSSDDYALSVEPLQRAVEALEELGKHAEASFNASMLADSLSALGRFDEAELAIDRATQLGELGGDPNSVLDADIIRGSIASDRGDLVEAERVTRRGIEMAEQVGNTFCDLAGNFKLADQQLRLGNVQTAIDHLERSTGLAAYCNAGSYEALAKAWLVKARSQMGDVEIDRFDEPLASAIEAGTRSGEGLIRLQRAIALADSGELGDAVADFERAIELFADYGGLPNLARAHNAYGQALEANGRGDDALLHLQQAETLFAELGIQPDPATNT